MGWKFGKTILKRNGKGKKLVKRDDPLTPGEVFLPPLTDEF
jgi:hypothetical protein